MISDMQKLMLAEAAKHGDNIVQIFLVATEMGDADTAEYIGTHYLDKFAVGEQQDAVKAILEEIKKWRAEGELA